jgi:hypothetical protein
MIDSIFKQQCLLLTSPRLRGEHRPPPAAVLEERRGDASALEHLCERVRGRFTKAGLAEVSVARMSEDRMSFPD